MKKIRKSELIKKGKQVFGDIQKFNSWLNTECVSLNCKPIYLYEKDKLKEIFDELIKIESNLKK
jgi:hypothetical protein